jgi:hypothetical protein
MRNRNRHRKHSGFTHLKRYKNKVEDTKVIEEISTQIVSEENILSKIKNFITKLIIK